MMIKKTTKGTCSRQNDMEIWTEALEKINMTWDSNPTGINGQTLNDDVTYNKIRQLIECPEMESAHSFLYDIEDPDNISEETRKKVNDLYDLAVTQGFIEDLNSENEIQNSSEDNGEDDVNSQDNLENDNSSSKEINSNEKPRAWTCLYSAIKPSGEIVSGEFYSNAKDQDSAKMDAISRLTGLGLKSVEVLAVETGDLNQVGNVEDSGDTAQPKWENDEDWSISDQTLQESMDDEEEKEEKSKTSSKDYPEDDGEKTTKADKKNDNEEEKSSDSLSKKEKLDLVSKFVQLWKDTLKTMRIESYMDMEIDDISEFWQRMNSKWESEIDPKEFMDDENQSRLMKLRIAI